MPRFVRSLLAASALAGSAFGQGYVHTAVAKTNDAAPGTALAFGVPATATDPAGFGAAVIGQNGQSIFLARVTHAGVTGNVNDIGSWALTAGGSVVLQARLGDTAPGTGGAVFAADASNGLGIPYAAGGVFAQRAFLGGTGVTAANDTALYHGPAGAYSLLAREGSAAPGTGGANFSGFSDPQLLNDGRAFFHATLTGTGVTTANDGALFVGTPAALTRLYREGDAAPGTTAAFSTVSGSFSVSANGFYTVRGALVVGGSVTTSNNAGQWGGSVDGSLSLLLRTGDVAPGIGQAITSLGLVVPLANGTFVSSVTTATGGAVTSANNGGLYAGTAQANMTLVARRGDQVPGEAAGLTIGQFGNPIPNGNTVAGRGTVAGTGVTANVNDRAIFTWSQADGVRLVARQGNTAPNTGGASFGALGTSNPDFGSSLLVNTGPAGDVIFWAPLTGTGVTTANDAAIFFGKAGSLAVVAREGDVIDLDPGPGTDFATLQSLGLIDSLLGNAGGNAVADGAGQVVWSAIFTDGRKATFVSVVPVPEPSLAVGLGLGLVVARRRFARREQN